MNPNSVEKIAQKRLTREFIKADAISVQLVRHTKVASGAGGVSPGPASTLVAQSFRLVPANSSVFQSIRNKLEGNIPEENFLLIGKVDADILPKDEFELDGGKYEVTYISTERSYQTAASVVYRGRIG